MLVGVVLAGSACGPPDRPPISDPELSTAAVEYLNPSRVATFRIAPGVTYRDIESAHEPWGVHLLEVDPMRCDIGFRVVRAEESDGRQSVSDLARAQEPSVIAGVNGSFFTEENQTLGVEASGGELRGRAARPVFAWRPDQVPWVGPVHWEGDSLRVGRWWLHAEDPDDRTEMLPGFPALLADGRWVGDLEQEARPAFAASRDPRTAVGWDPDRQRLWLVVVDGRRDRRQGMTLPELAELLRALGARDAVNLDGGGSSAMVVRGQLVSRPSDPLRERPVVNALLVHRSPDRCSGGR